jgi:formylglycine-generating enzyme required for sulfatase activity/dienelactone hydrolase/predicted Ser/Thr protein kinase
MTSLVGRSISHYEILSELGRGGMGIVYRARDLRLHREIALKVLPPDMVSDTSRRKRFLVEARAAAALSHPNIGVVHDIDEVEGSTFIAMELIDGASLSVILDQGPLRPGRALSLASQLAEGLARAHEKGIIHRDLKPANVMVTKDDIAKIIDFGLAKLAERSDSSESGQDTDTASLTGAGALLGTPAYMSPEQARGQDVDHRGDIFSFGVILYQMLTGQRPFVAPTKLDTLRAIVDTPPPPLVVPSGEDTSDVQYIVDKCLAKEPADRYQGTRDLVVDLRAATRRLHGSAHSSEAPLGSSPRWIQRPRTLRWAVIVGLLVACGAAAHFFVQRSRERWARSVALPEVARLAREEQHQAAFRLIRQAALYLPDDPRVDEHINEITHVARIDSAPEGASVYFADYLDPTAEWELAGTTPIVETRVPYGLLRWRLTRSGYEDTVGTGWAAGGSLAFRLPPEGTVPPGMVLVPGGPRDWSLWGGTVVEVDDFFIDRFEVTNADFKRFVDAGGYGKREYWVEPFVKSGSAIPWEEAIREFRDRTGRPGPANWTVGTFPDGQGGFPVSGVSWYEAAAYTRFVGKSLPTLHHWGQAAFGGIEHGLMSDPVRLANFDSEGPWAVGKSRSLGKYGTLDQAGNVSEWTATAAGDKRYCLGGSWNDPAYMSSEYDAASPLERSQTRGFRCATYPQPLSDELVAPYLFASYEQTWSQPADDTTFEIYRSLYARSPRNLDVSTVDVEDAPDWRRESVIYDAGYEDERVPAQLFLPKHASPPYQTVLYFPHGWALFQKSSQNLEMRWIAYLIRSGRAVLCPVVKGTFERRENALAPGFFADSTLSWAKEVSRSVDYLATRADIDMERIAYYGFSLGAHDGPIFAVTEPRFKTMVLLAGGLLTDVPPHVDPVHFAPRATLPVLLVAGKDDFALHNATLRMYELFGTPPQDKRLALLEGGHIPARLEDVIREVLDWLDRYLGPV